MEQKEILIKVCNDKIYLNPRLFIPIERTSIPKKHLTFRSREDIFWKVELLEYLPLNKCLKLSVKDYNANNVINFERQEPKMPVEELLFEKFDWQKLEPLLIYYQKSRLIEMLFNTETRAYSEIEKQTKTLSRKPDSFYANIQPSVNSYQVEEKPTIIRTIEDFWVSFVDSNFKLGYISFKKRIKKIGKELDFAITNEHILPEFDSIKFWFAKKLKTKKFKVSATITFTNHTITEIAATSQEIDQITPELIDSVKYQRTLSLPKQIHSGKIDKDLFTGEEIFGQINSDDIEGNVFNQSEEDILDFFLKESTVRNKKQLAYLAGKKQSENYKLRYTMNPNFGFLFFIEGKENNHFVWELLNSHATYIWSVEKGIQNEELQFKRIEKIINTIRTNGRETYKQAYRNNHQDEDLVFRVINHKHIDSELVDAFPKWKSKLNEQLT